MVLVLVDILDEDVVIVEGYVEYVIWCFYLVYLWDFYGDFDIEMDVDGIGGVSILVKVKVFCSGVYFLVFSFEKYVEIEGFGKVFEVDVVCENIMLICFLDGKVYEVFCCWIVLLCYLVFLWI